MAGSDITAPTANRKGRTVTIADSASLSGAIDTLGQTLCGLITPSGWTTATISFQASIDGTNYFNVYSASGSEILTGSIAASTWVVLDPADFAGCQYLKVRSGSSSAATNQSGSDIVTLIFRSV